MRQKDVRDLIEHIESNLEKVKREYEASIQSESISASLKIDVKNLMENIRSVLDYLAHDIYEKVIQPARASLGKKEIRNIYFPYGRVENDFRSSLARSLPGLGSLSPDVLARIERIQPYKCGNDWLYDVCSIVNQIKHDQLIPQTREEKRGLKLDFAGGGGITLGPGAVIKGSGRIVSGNSVLDLKGKAISGDSPVEDLPKTIKQTVVVWVGFQFADTGVEVLPLLQLAAKEVDNLANDIYLII